MVLCEPRSWTQFAHETKPENSHFYTKLYFRLLYTYVSGNDCLSLSPSLSLSLSLSPSASLPLSILVRPITSGMVLLWCLKRGPTQRVSCLQSLVNLQLMMDHTMTRFLIHSNTWVHLVHHIRHLNDASWVQYIVKVYNTLVWPARPLSPSPDYYFEFYSRGGRV